MRKANFHSLVACIAQVPYLLERSLGDVEWSAVIDLPSLDRDNAIDRVAVSVYANVKASMPKSITAKESTRLTKGTFSSVALARGFIAGDSPEQENQRNIRETREILEDIRRQQREQLVALGL